MSSPQGRRDPGFLSCPWSLKDVVIVFIYAAALFFVFSFWLSCIYAVLHFLNDRSLLQVNLLFKHFRAAKDFYAVILFYVALMIALHFKIFRKHHVRFSDFFTQNGAVKSDIIYGVKMYGKFLAVIFLTVVLVYCGAMVWDVFFGAGFLEKVNVYFIASEVEKIGLEHKFRNAAGIALLFIVAPFFEELFFRGCLYRALRARYSYLLSLGISSFAFALLHGYFFLFIYVFLVGLILGHMYEARKTLTAPLTFHMLNNLIVLVLFFIHFA